MEPGGTGVVVPQPSARQLKDSAHDMQGQGQGAAEKAQERGGPHLSTVPSEAGSVGTAEDADAAPPRPTCVVSSPEQMAAVRAGLAEWENARASDEDVCRFLRAANRDPQHAIKRLKFTLNWRREERPEACLCSACTAKVNSHYMHVVGHDREGRPVIYSCFNMAANRSVEENREHMIQTFEEAVALMPPGVERWIWITDFKVCGGGGCAKASGGARPISKPPSGPFLPLLRTARDSPSGTATPPLPRPFYPWPGITTLSAWGPR